MIFITVRRYLLTYFGPIPSVLITKPQSGNPKKKYQVVDFVSYCELKYKHTVLLNTHWLIV